MTFPNLISARARPVAAGALIGLLLASVMAGLYAAPPIANAGPDRVDVPMQVAQTLDGTASSDPAGRPLVFAWKIIGRPGGSSAILLNPSSPTPVFTPDLNGRYEISLTVKAGREAATDTVIVTTRNRPPTADGGVDVGARIGKRVRLVGLGSDPDGDRLTYFWRVLSKPLASRVSFAKPSLAATTLTLDRPGDYVVQFEVRDPFGLSAADAVAITHINSPPVTKAGPDEQVAVGTTVALDASGSSDVDEDQLTYIWTLKAPKGSGASLSDPVGLQPTFTVDVPGSYTATVTAHDGSLSGNADSVVVTTTPLNGRPIADAGHDRKGSAGQLVQLDGSRSSDPDGQALSHSWELQKKPRASAAALSSTSDLRPEFLMDVPGTYVARLVVRDSAGVPSGFDSITVTTSNVAPVADAGPDMVASVGSIVQLNGNGSTDVNGNELAYGWALIYAPATSAVTLSDTAAVNPAFVPDALGTYVFQLIVNDGRINSAPDTVVVTTGNVRPRASAGADQTVPLGSPVSLDGSGSSDANGDPLVFAWYLAARPPGSHAMLPDSSNPTPAFTPDVEGDYALILRVSDGTLWSAPAAVVVTTRNSIPVANPGPDRLVGLGAVTLDGSASTDPDGSMLTYDWSLLARPAGSVATLSGTTGATLTFVADLVGDYVAQLIVSDGALHSPPATVLIAARGLASVAIQATDATASEAGTDPGTFLFTRSGPLTAALDVAYAIGGTATNGVDYLPSLTGQVTIPAGQDSVALTITPVDDGVAEGTESVHLALLASAAYTVGTPASATVFIADDAPTSAFHLFVPNTKVLPQARLAIAIVLDNPASGALSVTLRSSDDTVLIVPSAVVIGDGSTSAWFDATSLTTLGIASVTAEAPGSGTAAVQITVSDESSALLIDRAEAAGEITEEQAYVYRVFGAFGWPGLPERFKGAVASGEVDVYSELFAEARDRFDTLSPEAQEQLAPLFVPPIYEGSWGDPAVLAAAAEAARGGASFSDRLRSAGRHSAAGVVLCSEGSRPQRLPVWANYEKGPFRVWYLADPLPYKSFIGTPEQSKRVADVVAGASRDDPGMSEAEWAFGTLQSLFDRQLIDDAGASVCDGGDGKYDIYTYGLTGGPLGQMFRYNKAPAPTATWIALNAAGNWGADDNKIRATLAHEMMHAVDYLFKKATPDWWRIEAMGIWAENFVYPDNGAPNLEWEHAKRFFSHRSPDGAGGTVSDVLLPFTTLTTDATDTSEDQWRSKALSGYSKYIFFFFLQHRYNAAVLKSMLQKEEVSRTMLAIHQALVAEGVSGGFAAAWANFGVTAWNDTSAGGARAEFAAWDNGLPHGMSEEFRNGFLLNPCAPAHPGSKFSPWILNLACDEARLRLPMNYLEKPEGIYVGPLSTVWMHAQFTDDTTSFVLLDLPTPGDGVLHKVQALFKSNGAWSAPVDLSKEPYKVWCRDRPADQFPEHKLEEIILVASNAAPTEAVDPLVRDWNWYDADDKDRAPHLVVSNIGCWQWTGRATSTITIDRASASGAREVNTAEGVTFELSDEELKHAAEIGMGQFRLVDPFGSVQFQISGTLGSGSTQCTFTGGPESRPIRPGSGALTINFAKWAAGGKQVPGSRDIDVLGNTDDPPEATVRCPGMDPSKGPMPFPLWMILPFTVTKIGADGGRVSGTFAVPEAIWGFPISTEIQLDAVRK